jgi:hypothetical protein
VPDLDQLRDLDRLRELGRDERRQLLRALVALETRETPADRAARRRRAIVLTAIVVCCVVLAAWIGVLAVTLPRHYQAGGWRGAWVGFDIVLLAVFAMTGWAAWKRRQLLIICLIVLATLLCCDAWFDVTLDAHTSGFDLSVLSAVCVELPLATLASLGARRLLRMNFALIRRYAGDDGPAPSLRQGQLASDGPAHHSRLSHLFGSLVELNPQAAQAARAAPESVPAEAVHAEAVHAEAVPDDGPGLVAASEPGPARDGKLADLDGPAPSS